MTFYIDAWLDRPQPFIQVKNKHNQQVVAEFEGEELSKALECGEFCLCDFYDARTEAQMELIKSLLLLRCCEDMGKDIQKIYSDTLVSAQQRRAAIGMRAKGRSGKVVAFPRLKNANTIFA